MTVTSPPAELRMAAARAHAQGMYEIEAHLLTEAMDNNTVVQRNSTAATAAATDLTNRTAAIRLSRVRKNSGADGRVISSGPVS